MSENEMPGFPEKERHSLEIYLDNAATTKPCPQAVAAVMQGLTTTWGNPSAVHQLGLDAEKAVKHARGQVAHALGCSAEQLFFTSGGTEGDNFAVFSVAQRYHKRGRHIITTAVEHHAVLHPIQALEAQGFEITYLQPQPDGTVSPQDLLSVLRKDTILVSIMMVNNETGAVNDIARLAKLTHQKSTAVFHTDAVQGFCKVPFRASSLGADIISVSSHKIQGPKGCGAVYVDKKLHLPPVMYGGGQEKNMRSGTENVPMILGFGAACEAASDHLADKLHAMEQRKEQCLTLLAQKVPQAVILGSHQAPHIISLAIPGVRSQGLIGYLQEQGVYVSAGSACSRGHRSHVLEAMHFPPEQIDGSIRVSFCFDTTAEDIEGFVSALKEAVHGLA